MMPSKLPIFLLLWLILVVPSSESQTLTWSSIQRAPKEISLLLSRDPQSLSLGSTDYGHVVHDTPVAVFNPTNPNDISALLNYSNSLPTPFTVGARGEAHSVNGQAMAQGGVVVNMSSFRNISGSDDGRIVVLQKTASLGSEYVADAGGEQMWIDVLHAALEHGLSPVAWTDYLYLTVGGTLSNAGISGQSFHFGPQIMNVNELDVITGKGELVTCSAETNSDLFYGVLGGLGQFGVKWVRMLYDNFGALTHDQEILISTAQKKPPNYLEGLLLLKQDPLDISFYPPSDQTRIISLLTQNGNILYEVEELVGGLRFVPTFMFEKDVTYEEFLNRVHSDELILRSQGLWDLPHPWLNLFVPKSRILEFDEGVFKGIILKNNLTAGVVLVYPMNRNKWEDRMSAVVPDEDVFYAMSLLPTSKSDMVEAYKTQNQMILHFCEDNGIHIKQYLPQYKTLEQWKKHFGDKWKLFQHRKKRYDPKNILSPGQAIFNN
ncbi:cytokinin dehydrogenase 3-like [Senna tora]|uniref:cytokinin dehydrogenase n=1 Tax=Senna tora TaxID=362788 RepID=A0A834X518_9FABA|nr:cytokinin dehydrogenase 3-like [Senna tora]